MRCGLIIARMVIHMNEARLTTIEQIEAFLSASTSIEFSAAGGDSERYEHISRVLTRFDRTLFIFLVLLNKRLIPFPSLCGGEEVAIGQLNTSSKCRSVL